ncbi:MAG: head GIN domain-containing protein [Bacteroidales bacterium]
MKKSNILLLAALAISIVIMFGGLLLLRSKVMASIEIGSGKMVEIQRTTQDWERIKVQGNIQVFFTQTEPSSLTVKADENLLEFIRTEVVNNQLIIETTRAIHSRNELQVELHNPFLAEVEAIAGSRFTTRNPLELSTLRIIGNAGAQMSVQGFFDVLDVVQAAGARINLSGKTDQLTIRSDAGGRVDALELEARQARVEANAGASASVNAQLLDARAAAGGTINYVGNPVFSVNEATAGGQIRHRN